MPVTAQNLTSDSDTAALTVHTTASVSPPAGQLLLLAVNHAAGESEIPVVTGNGLAWELVLTQAASRLSLFRAMSPTTPAPGTVTIAYTSAPTLCQWSLDAFAGVTAAGTNGAGAVRQTAEAANNSTTLSVPLAAFANADNGVYACFTHAADEETTPLGALNILADVSGLGPAYRLAALWDDAPDLAPGASWASGVINRAIAVELVAGAVAGVAAVAAVAVAGTTTGVVFGPLVASRDVRLAVRDTVQMWIGTYLAEVAERSGRARTDLAVPRSYVSSVDLDRYAEDQLPSCVIVAPGLMDTPERHGDAYRCRWAVGVGVVVAGQSRDNTFELAELYAAAVRSALLQHPSLGGFAEGLQWAGERYDEISADDAARTLAAGVVQFGVDVLNAVDVAQGPLLPHPDPPDWGIVTDVETSTIRSV